MTESTPKGRAACPSCQSRFVIPDGMIGKKAKCPKCGQPFIIAEDQPDKSPTSTKPQETMAFQQKNTPAPPQAVDSSPPPATAKAVKNAMPPPSKKIEVPAWALTFGVPLVSLALGYFIGREHLKYQMLSAFKEVGKEMSKGLNNIPMPPFPSLPNPVADAPLVPDPPTPKISIGKTYDAGKFTVEVTEARVGSVRLRDFQNPSFDSASPFLKVTLLFQNKDDRKSLRFRGNQPFSTPYFRIRDDVDNIVQPVNFGMMIKVVGAIENAGNLKPEESLQHLEVFEVPLPKTQKLTLTIDLACFDGEGELQVDIPYENVQKENP